MTVIGRIKPLSYVYVNWSGNGFVHANLKGVTFHKNPDKSFTTEPLSEEEIGWVKGHEAVILEVIGTEEPQVPEGEAPPMEISEDASSRGGVNLPTPRPLDAKEATEDDLKNVSGEPDDETNSGSTSTRRPLRPIIRRS